jgi:hypothetical protein
MVEQEKRHNSTLPTAQEETPGHSGIQREEALQALVTAVRKKHSNAVEAVLFYGSCLRSGDPAAGIADFYVVVSSYRAAGMGRVAAAMNRLIPPNVFYLETPCKGHILRAKYAVVRLDQFVAGASGEWLLPYLWGRFAQPSQIAWARNPDRLQSLNEVLDRARHYFLEQSANALSGEFTTASLWQEALLMSYKTELRAERLEKIRGLIQADPDYYAENTLPCLQSLAGFERFETDQPAPAMEAQRFRLNPPAAVQKKTLALWGRRRFAGKLMSIARLFKSLFTFSGAVDYAAWKIQRHSGQPVEIPDWVRRYPWLGCWVVLWRVWRRGQLR